MLLFPRLFTLPLLAIGLFLVGCSHTPAPPPSERILETPGVETPAELPIPTPAAIILTPAPVSPATAVPTVGETLAPTGPVTHIATSADVIDIKRLRDPKALKEVHKVDEGENFWTIAGDNKIDLFTLIGANPGLPMKAKLNYSVNILNERGVLHTVQPGETLPIIAARYKADPKVLKSVNDIHWWWWKTLKAGDVLFIPGAKPLRMTQDWQTYFSKRGIFGDPLGRWGIITSPFGKRSDPLTGDVRHHSGVDLRAKYGDKVYAAAGGRVIFTGISGGYGNLIQIAHGNGFITFYGHLSKIFVQQGQKIRRGQLIGRVGATGRVTGPHLHFEIRKNGKAVDPLPYI